MYTTNYVIERLKNDDGFFDELFAYLAHELNEQTSEILNVEVADWWLRSMISDFRYLACVVPNLQIEGDFVDFLLGQVEYNIARELHRHQGVGRSKQKTSKWQKLRIKIQLKNGIKRMFGIPAEVDDMLAPGGNDFLEPNENELPF